MTLSADSAGHARAKRGLLWRVPLWFVIALLLSFACAYVGARVEKDIPKVFDPVFYLPATVLGAGTAWAFGLFGSRTTIMGKLFVALGSFVAPIIFFLIAIVVVVVDVEAHIELPPAIARGQDFGMEGVPLANAKWTSSLNRDFPSGSSESHLIAVLRSQGFHVDRTRRLATIDYQIDLPCREYLWIDWTLASDGRIATVSGTAGGMCL